MTEGTQIFSVIAWIADQGGDNTLPAWEVPQDIDIVAVLFHVNTGFSADGSNHNVLTLQDGGSDGTGTTTIESRGGASVAWVADTTYDLTGSSIGETAPYSIDKGDRINLKWDETGTVAMNGQLQINYKLGHRGSA